MRVAVLYDGEVVGGTPDLLIMETAKAVQAALVANDYQTSRVPIRPDGRWIEKIRSGRFDLAFNVCDGVNGVSVLEPAVIGTLELLGIPYSGNGSWTLSICLRKNIVNTLLDRIGLPVPRWRLVRRGDPLPTIGFPVICKPAAEDASVGIEQRSVVTDRRSLALRLSELHEKWDEILVQRFIDGREVNVGFVAGRVLPLSEIDFSEMPKQYWRIVSFRSKWEPGCDEDVGAVPRCPARVHPKLAARIERIATSAWSAVGGTGYGRVDMRIDKAGRPWILEVNPNPDFSPGAGLARMGGAAGMDYNEMVRLVAEEAVSRTRDAAAERRWAVTQNVSSMPPGAPVIELLSRRRGRP